MAPVHRPDPLPSACAHLKAVIDGTIQARQLADRSWRYLTPFRCDDCGRKWSEVHDQTMPRDTVGK